MTSINFADIGVRTSAFKPVVPIWPKKLF